MSAMAFCRSCQSIELLEGGSVAEPDKFWCQTCGYPITYPDVKQAASHAGPPTILCIDDDRLVLRVCAEALVEQGYRVLTATDGSAGIATAKQELPDLILLDVIMPGMDGLAVCRQLRADPSLTATPIILLTSLTHPELVAEGRLAGATLTMRKPNGPGSVVSVVDHALGRKPRPMSL
jgi:CheY-like chemotaxis protein